MGINYTQTHMFQKYLHQRLKIVKLAAYSFIIYSFLTSMAYYVCIWSGTEDPLYSSKVGLVHLADHKTADDFCILARQLYFSLFCMKSIIHSPCPAYANFP